MHMCSAKSDDNNNEQEGSDDPLLQALSLVSSVCNSLDEFFGRTNSTSTSTSCTTKEGAHGSYDHIPQDDLRLAAKANAKMGDVQKVCMHVCMHSCCRVGTYHHNQSLCSLLFRCKKI